MNQKDKERLNRLYRIINAVPFSASGSKSQSVAGLAGYEQDMRAFLPAIKETIKGIAADGYEWEEGYDYQDPDLMLDALEAWIEKRKLEQWQGATEHDFRCFYVAFRQVRI